MAKSMLDMTLDDIVEAERRERRMERRDGPIRRGGYMRGEGGYRGGRGGGWNGPYRSYGREGTWGPTPGRTRGGGYGGPSPYGRSGPYSTGGGGGGMNHWSSNSSSSYGGGGGPNSSGVHWSWSNGPRGGSSTAIVRISGLDYSVLDSELRELMEKSCEGILKVWIDYDKTDRSRGTGGCVFRTLADAQRAVETFDGRRIEGKPLRLELQRPRGPPGGPPNSWGQSQGQGPSSWGQGPPRGGDRGYNRW